MGHKDPCHRCSIIPYRVHENVFESPVVSLRMMLDLHKLLLRVRERLGLKLVISCWIGQQILSTFNGLRMLNTLGDRIRCYSVPKEYGISQMTNIHDNKFSYNESMGINV